MSRRWSAICAAVGLAVSLAACLALGGAARAAAATDPEDAVKQLNQWYNEQLQEARKPGATVDYRKLAAERIEKAKALVADAQPAATEPAKCLALGQLYQAAQMWGPEAEALNRFLGSNPAPESAFTAQQMLLSAYGQTEDAKGIVKTVGSIKPPSAQAAAQLATMVGARYAETVGEKLGPKAALDLVSKVEALVPFAELQTDREKQAGESARVYLATARADLLAQQGKRAQAVAALKAAQAQLPPGGRAAGQLTSKLALLQIVGSPAPALVRERGYGEFAGLDKWRGKVVVIDFGAHW